MRWPVRAILITITIMLTIMTMAAITTITAMVTIITMIMTTTIRTLTSMIMAMGTNMAMPMTATVTEMRLAPVASSISKPRFSPRTMRSPSATAPGLRVVKC